MDYIDTVLSASKNAVIYGYRVRFIHSIAVQMGSMDRRRRLMDQIVEKVIRSIRLGLDHGKLLALFALIYSSVQLSLNQIAPKRTINHFIGGFLGGILVYGGVLNMHFKKFVNEAIATQITMYCLSRVVLALGKWLSVKLQRRTRLRRAQIEKVGWRTTSGLVWGLLMVFYNVDKDLYLQRALRHSLDFQFGGTWYSWLEAFNYAR
ncbi:hypothetical protein KL921_001479 [Ogataea angusta]|nr:hypothetical protein KL921_001479 [Ogataea angusta]